MKLQAKEPKFNTVIQSIDEIVRVLSKTENYKKLCTEQISECDRAESDLNHRLEFEKLDAIELVKQESLRKKILQHRRFYKDELELANAVHITNQNILRELKDAANRLEAVQKRLSERQYTPRVLFELFDCDADEIQRTRQDMKNIQVITGRKPNKKQIEMEKKFREVKSS